MFVALAIITWTGCARRVRHGWLIPSLTLIMAWQGLVFAVVLRWRVGDGWLLEDEAHLSTLLLL